MRILVVVMALLTSAEAIACPPGPCLKYRRLARPQAPVSVYRMISRGVAPPRFDRRWLTRFLDGSVWTEATGPTQRTIEFRTAANVDRPTNTRMVLIRELEQRNGTTYVAVDGIFYALGRCKGATCLTLVGPLPDEASRQRFATPP